MASLCSFPLFPFPFFTIPIPSFSIPFPDLDLSFSIDFSCPLD